MHLKLIACEVLLREVCFCIAQSPHVIDLEFTEKDDHNRSDYLRGLIQSKIDAAEQSDRKYDAILLGYGLCGNSTVDIIARQKPVVIPRAHDCCTLFLGSKLRFKEFFANNPSLPFSSGGYMSAEILICGSPASKACRDVIKALTNMSGFMVKKMPTTFLRRSI